MLLAAASVRLSLAVAAVALAAAAGVAAGVLARRPRDGSAAAPAQEGPEATPLSSLQQQTRRILDGMAEGVVGLDPRGRVTFSNPAATRILGWGPRDLLGSPFSHLVLGREEGSAAEDVALTLQDGRSRDRSAVPFRRRDGSRFEGEFVVSALREDGQVAGGVLVFRDLSERTAAEQRFRQLLEAAPDAMVLVDADGKILLVNRQAETLFQYDRSELVGKPVELLVPAALQGAHAAHREEYLREPRLRPMGAGLDLRAARKDGTSFAVEISLSPMPTPEGVQVIAIVRDVSQQRRHGARPDAPTLPGFGSWEWDAATDAFEVGDDLRRLLGVPPRQRVDWARFLAAVHPDDREAVEAVLRQVLRDHHDFTLLHRAGRPEAPRVLLMRGRAVVRDDGTVLRLQGSTLDVTALPEGQEVLAGRRPAGRWQAAAAGAETG